MITIITLVIFTLILFSFGLGVLFGKTFFQLPKPADSAIFTQEIADALVSELRDSSTDFERDFIDFSGRN